MLEYITVTNTVEKNSTWTIEGAENLTIEDKTFGYVLNFLAEKNREWKLVNSIPIEKVVIDDYPKGQLHKYTNIYVFARTRET